MYGFFVCWDKKSGGCREVFCCGEVAVSGGAAEIYHVSMNFVYNSWSLLPFSYQNGWATIISTGRRLKSVPVSVYMFIITRDDVVSQRLKFGSAFLSSSLGVKNCIVFLTFPYPVPVPKNCMIFIGCNFKSMCKSGWIAQAEKRYCVIKEGKSTLVSLQRRGGRRLKAVL